MKELCKRVKVEIYKADQAIITEGSIGDSFYIILKGQAAVLKAVK